MSKEQCNDSVSLLTDNHLANIMHHRFKHEGMSRPCPCFLVMSASPGLHNKAKTGVSVGSAVTGRQHGLPCLASLLLEEEA